jgi:hypothetical protein
MAASTSRASTFFSAFALRPSAPSCGSFWRWRRASPTTAPSIWRYWPIRPTGLRISRRYEPPPPSSLWTPRLPPPCASGRRPGKPRPAGNDWHFAERDPVSLLPAKCVEGVVIDCDHAGETTRGTTFRGRSAATTVECVSPPEPASKAEPRRRDVLDLAEAHLAGLAECACDRSARDGPLMASERLPRLLAMEVEEYAGSRQNPTAAHRFHSPHLVGPSRVEDRNYNDVPPTIPAASLHTIPYRTLVGEPGGGRGVQ